MHVIERQNQLFSINSQVAGTASSDVQAEADTTKKNASLVKVKHRSFSRQQRVNTRTKDVGSTSWDSQAGEDTLWSISMSKNLH